jgi:hypothetical protein
MVCAETPGAPAALLPGSSKGRRLRPLPHTADTVGLVHKGRLPDQEYYTGGYNGAWAPM